MPDTVAVAIELRPRDLAALADALRPVAEPVYLPALAPDARMAAVRAATVALARHTGRDFLPGEAAALGSAKLVQFITAGLDFIPMDAIPAHVPVAGNGGAYSEPMAEHALGMALAAAKRMIPRHEALRRGEFPQMERSKMLAGGTCGIVGFGGIGQASARLFRAIGMQVHAINRSGASDQPTDWIGTMNALPELLAASDVVILSTPLTPATQGLIGPAELGIMKKDAIIVNLARGDVIQQAPLFAHLKANPDFHACIDAWWIEPVRQGEFRMDFPFTDLPNVVGSPHNSATVPGMMEAALRRAAVNIRRALAGEPPHYVLGPAERMV